MIRWIEKITSSAVTGLPLWNAMPSLSRIVHASGLLAGLDRLGDQHLELGKSGVRTASDSYRFHWRMMSGSIVGRCASIVSFAPPPVAPTRSVAAGPELAAAPPGCRRCPATAAVIAAAPITVPPAASTAPPLSAPRSTWRRVTAVVEPFAPRIVRHARSSSFPGGLRPAEDTDICQPDSYTNERSIPSSQF